jgi:hypothetical protein
MSETLRLAAGALLVVAGIALVVVAALGARSRLPRNRFAGVRTAHTLRSEAAFALANRVAAAPSGAAGGVALVGGIAAVCAGPGAVGWVLVALTAVGMLALAGLGGMLGDRAAARLAELEPAPSACSGTCAGCDLVAGCGSEPHADPDSR